MKEMKVNNEMASRGRIGGFVRASKYPPEDLTGAARVAFLRNFEPQDPNLSPEERRRRGQAALKAHMARLARLSALARRGKR